MAETVQFGNLVISIAASGDGTEVVYTFKGEVDESFKQKDLPRIKAQKIVLVLEDIRHLNSCGIREWVYMVRELSKMGRLIFKKCSVAMVDQINMVPDSVRGAEIESFYAPYACDEHGEIAKLVDMKSVQTTRGMPNPPTMHCDDCSRQLEFDALPGSYFLFCTMDIPKAS